MHDTVTMDNCKTVLLVPRNGLGDKLLDTLGFCMFCRGNRVRPVIDWCSTDDYQPWGNARYDKGLFQFPFLTGQGPTDIIAISSDPSASFCPDYVKRYLRIPDEDTTIYDAFVRAAQEMFTVSPELAAKAPQHIESCIGIHLRRKDKVGHAGDIDARHETELSQLDPLMKHVRSYARDLVAKGVTHFFVCGDDDDTTEGFKQTLREMSSHVCIVQPDYTTCSLHGEAAVLDWYCLTRCWKIVQGINYSTFSMSAALVSQAPLVNFADHKQNALLHLWKPCLDMEPYGDLAEPLPVTSHIRDAQFRPWVQRAWWNGFGRR